MCCVLCRVLQGYMVIGTWAVCCAACRSSQARMHCREGFYLQSTRFDSSPCTLAPSCPAPRLVAARDQHLLVLVTSDHNLVRYSPTQYFPFLGYLVHAFHNNCTSKANHIADLWAQFSILHTSYDPGAHDPINTSCRTSTAARSARATARRAPSRSMVRCSLVKSMSS